MSDLQSFSAWRRENSGTMADYHAALRANLTPYDTGKRAEPKQWEKRHFEDEDDYGKVDFNAEDDFTIATLYIEKGGDGSYTLKGYTNEPLKVDIEAGDPDEPQVYWDMAHDGDDEHTPYGDDTARIIDLQAGGVIAYCHKDNADKLVRALWVGYPGAV